MKEIPLKVFARQSLSIMLEQSLYEISLKECNGIMAATIIRDGVTIVSNRRVCAGMTIIPEGHLEEGNFVILTENGEIPYYTGFESTDVMVYFTVEEIAAIRLLQPTGPLPGSIPSGPLVDFDYMARKLADGMDLTRSTIGTYLLNNVLKTAAINVSRFDDKGLLVEDTSINVAIPSESWGAMANAQGTWSSTAIDSNGWITVSGVSNPSANEGSYRDFADNQTLQNLTATFSLDVKKVSGYKFTINVYAGGTGGDRLGNYSVTFKDGNPLPTNTGWNVIDRGEWLRISITRSFGNGTSIFRIYPFGSNIGSSGALTYRRVQIEKQPIASSYIKTTTAAGTRAADVITLTQSGAKTVYREYIPLGATDVVKEFIEYNGVLCPPGHLQKLKVWNRELTDEEKRNV